VRLGELEGRGTDLDVTKLIAKLLIVLALLDTPSSALAVVLLLI